MKTLYKSKAHVISFLSLSSSIYGLGDDYSPFDFCTPTPTPRSTAFGVHSGVGRLGAILGNVMFGHLLDVNRGIPVLIVACLLTVGAVCALLLPPIYRAENRPPLERCLYKIRKKCKKKTVTNT